MYATSGDATPTTAPWITQGRFGPGREAFTTLLSRRVTGTVAELDASTLRIQVAPHRHNGSEGHLCPKKRSGPAPREAHLLGMVGGAKCRQIVPKGL